MAAGAGLALRPQGLVPPRLLHSMKQRAALPVVLNVAYSFRGGIDALAHFGGGLAGFALMVSGLLTRGLVPTWSDAPRPLEPARPAGGGGTVRAAALVAAALFASAIATAMITNRPWELRAPALVVAHTLGDTGLALRLPATLGPMVRDGDEDHAAFVFGALDRDPLVTEVVVGRPLGGRSPARRPLLDDAAELLETAPDAGRWTAPLRRIELDGQPALSRDGRFEQGVHFRVYARTVGDRPVLLRLYTTRALDERASATAEAIAASLRPATLDAPPG